MGTTIRGRRFGHDNAELDEIREKVALADADAKENWGDPEWMADMHQDLVEVIWRGFQHENLIELFSTVERADEFERITIEEAYGLEVFWVAAGSRIDQSVIYEDVWEMQRNYVGYHVSAFEDHIRSGFSKYISKLKPMAIQQMDASVNARLLRTIQVAIPPGNPSYVTNAGFNLADINSALTAVEDEASGWADYNGQLTIVGRGIMVGQIMNALQSNDNFAAETQDDIVKLGILGSYRGAKIVKLKNWKDRHARSFFPGNELMIVANNASKVGFWGGDKAKEWTEEGGEYWHTWGKRQVGFAVPHPEFARRIIDSTKAA